MLNAETPPDSAQSDSTAWDRVQSLAAEQDGYFTTWQAQKMGFARSRLGTWTRLGRVEKRIRGVYLVTVGPPLTPRVDAWLYERYLSLDGNRMPWKRGPTWLAISHTSAAHLLNLGTIPAELAEFTSIRRRTSVLSLVRIRQAQLPAGDWIWWADGRVPVTSAARTVVDLALAGVGRDYVERALMDSLRQGLTTRDQMWETLVRRRRHARHASVDWLEKAIAQLAGAA